MIKKYTIANFNIMVDIDRDEYFLDCLKAYENEFGGEGDICFNVKRTSKVIKADYTNLMKIGADKYYCKVDNRDAVINFDPQTGKIIALTRFSADYKAIDILSYDVTRDYDFECTHFNHNLMGNAMHYVTAMHGGFVFHSSSLACADGGVLFSAPSGTGKSTHTGLWLSQFDDTEIINDDTPIIRLNSDGGVDLCGTPWAGTSGINVNKVVPLKAIVFLARGDDNKMEKLASQEALKLFFEAILSPLTSTMHLKYLDTIKSIFVSVPIYRLSCNMNPDAAYVSRNGIFG